MNSSRKTNAALEIGKRITCFWPDDDQWYKGTVAEKLDDDQFWIKYDLGDEQEMDIKKDKWRILNRQDKDIKTIMERRKQALLDGLEVGSRISVYFPHEKEYYAGTVTKINVAPPHQSGPHRIKYDKGNKEVTDLRKRKFKRIRKKSDQLEVGSRVVVYDRNRKKYYRATVRKIKPERGARPHKVKYDKESRGKEWLNLHVHPFLNMPMEWYGKKRKEEFVDLERPHPKRRCQSQLRSNEEEEEQAVLSCEVHCAYCKTCTDAPYSASCHHIFCNQCVDSRVGGSKTCPICKIPINATLTPFGPDHASFQAVEALSKATAEVQMEFPSASFASMKKPGLSAYRIIQACKCKQRDGREHMGYYWRFKGSKDRILRVGEGIKEGIPVEQLDLETGELIQTFVSGREAHEATGVARCSIRRVLERSGKANVGGFFWRFKGETHGPWPDPEPTNLKPVEQLDWESGEILASFESLAEAKRAMGMAPNSGCIRDVCEGVGRGKASGFFWRWKGSNSLPNHLLGLYKIVEIRKKRNGRVVKVFKSSKDAQAFFGHQCHWNSICRYCREEGFYKGYYWRYRILSTPLNSNDAVIGKRLRIKQGDDNWLEGKVKSFCSSSGDHEIVFDCGTIERHCLAHIEYEWKNDQGQKPIEQLDSKTGEILNTFDSIADAARSIPNGVGSRISLVLVGTYKSSHGYFWRYKGSTALPRKKKGRQKINQLCLKTGRVIATFDTISDAGKAVGITTPGISYCCHGRNGAKSAGGFGWRFHKEDDD
mmetsp:Transcript_17504/g.43015  ORF Transcript_17504/g.43015 Transcript_17504/m.43015 type:complete len:768 (-) Transcript_17504:777-3080(-)